MKVQSSASQQTCTVVAKALDEKLVRKTNKNGFTKMSMGFVSQRMVAHKYATKTSPTQSKHLLRKLRVPFARAVCVPPFRGGNTKFFKSQTQKCPMPKNRDMHDNVQCEQDCTNTSQNAWHSRMQRTSLFFLVGGDCHITGSYSDSGRKQPSGRNQPITSIWIPPPQAS